jgi:competence protein ComK
MVIDENVMAIIAKNGGAYVYSYYGTKYYNKLSTEIVDKSCLFYGSSLKGRIKGTKEMIGISYKCPIIISENKGIIAFPTESYKNNNCCWFILSMIDNYYYENKKVYICFKNGQKISILLSFGSFDKQILRASRLYGVLNARK